MVRCGTEEATKNGKWRISQGENKYRSDIQLTHECPTVDSVLGLAGPPGPSKTVYYAALHNLIYWIQHRMLLEYSESVWPWLIILFVRTISGRLSQTNYHNKRQILTGSAACKLDCIKNWIVHLIHGGGIKHATINRGIVLTTMTPKQRGKLITNYCINFNSSDTNGASGERKKVKRRKGARRQPLELQLCSLKMQLNDEGHADGKGRASSAATEDS